MQIFIVDQHPCNRVRIVCQLPCEFQTVRDCLPRIPVILAKAASERTTTQSIEANGCVRERCRAGACR